MEHTWQNDEVKVILFVLEIIDKVGYNVPNKVGGSITFPVGNDTVFSIALHFVYK